MRRGKAPGRRPRAAAAPAPTPSGGSLDLAALLVLAVWTLGMSWVSLVLHRSPWYDVETDLLGEYIPAARELLAGAMNASHYVYKGFGYPLMLALAGKLAAGNFYLAARLLNLAAAAASAWVCYVLFRSFLGRLAGFAVLLGLLVNPTFVRSTVEAGTDLPAFGLMIAATYFIVFRSSDRAIALSGLLAGYAVITRYNAAFLALGAAGVLLSRRSGPRAWAAYFAAFALPVGAWLIANRAISGSAFTNLNYLNVAAEVYGLRMGWDVYWREVAPHFHSFSDVVRYDPALFFSRIFGNIAGYWLRDIRELLPLALGAIALPGMLLVWHTRAGWRALWAHYLLCYAMLVQVFYEPRFFLYLLPFYLGGTAAALLGPWLKVSRPDIEKRGGILRHLTAILAGCFIVALAASGHSAALTLRQLFADAPDEARAAGEYLREHGARGGKLYAGKPHAAYFAGLEFKAIPSVYNLLDVIRAGRQDGARYLLYSNIEQRKYPQFGLLQQRDLVLPGLRQLDMQPVREGHGYILYELTGVVPDGATFARAEEATLQNAVARQPADPELRLTLAGVMMELEQHELAARELRIANALSPADPRICAFLAYVYQGLGRPDSSAIVCESCIRARRGTPLLHELLGVVRLQMGQTSEAIEQLQLALSFQPANTDYLINLGWAMWVAGRYHESGETYGRVLALDPSKFGARLCGARAFARSGEPEMALALLAGARGTPAAAAASALEDSVRAGSLGPTRGPRGATGGG